jgi:hypothetical protein
MRHGLPVRLVWLPRVIFLSTVLLLALGGEATAVTPEKAKDQLPNKQPSSANDDNPLAPRLLPLLKQEMENGLKQRGIESQFRQFKAYGASKLDATAGAQRTSEVTGNCRLSWYDHLYRNPLTAPAEAEQFTRELHQAFRGDHQGFDQALRIARKKMDLGQREPHVMPAVGSPEQALEAVKQAIVGAQAGYAKAMSTLSRAEIQELSTSLVPVFITQNKEGHTLADRNTGRRLCDLMEKIDRRGFYDAADSLIPLTNPELLKQLAALPDDGDVKAEGVTGKVVRRIATPAGLILIGGKGKNSYDFNKMGDNVACVIDLGGDDVYLEGQVDHSRPVLVTIDLAGNDRYEGTKPGIQGAAAMGISMLVDVSGDDVYRAQDLAQGSALCGVGILVDFAGNDYYAGLRRVQGHALGGLGILLDRDGRDTYHAAMWAQGFGAPLGFGVLDDLAGNDHYFCGGLYLDSYPETPGYEGWGQGIGAGLRQVADGGIGVILDGGGDDAYEYDYISHGGGYWLGLGFARDFGGNDRRYGGTTKSYSGGPRGEPMFQRFSCGFGCHYALGFCFDDEGDDTYGGTIMGLGFAWDMSMGYLCDFGGNDRYDATGGHTEGCGAQASLGVLFDYKGDDTYVGYSQGYATPSISYHPLPQCGGNFSFLVDYGGKDSYGCGAQDNTVNVRGANGGFLIDRPLPGESTDTKSSDQASAPAKKRK